MNTCPYTKETDDMFWLFITKQHALTVKEVEYCIQKGAQIDVETCYGNLLSTLILCNIQPEIIQYFLQKGVQDKKIRREYFVYTKEIKYETEHIVGNCVSLFGDVKTALILKYYSLTEDIYLQQNIYEKLFRNKGKFHFINKKYYNKQKLIIIFNKYCNLFEYPCFNDFKDIAYKTIELPDDLHDIHNIPTWDPFEEYYG